MLALFSRPFSPQNWKFYYYCRFVSNCSLSVHQTTFRAEKACNRGRMGRMSTQLMQCSAYKCTNYLCHILGHFKQQKQYHHSMCNTEFTANTTNITSLQQNSWASHKITAYNEFRAPLKIVKVAPVVHSISFALLSSFSFFSFLKKMPFIFTFYDLNVKIARGMIGPSYILALTHSHENTHARAHLVR